MSGEYIEELKASLAIACASVDRLTSALAEQRERAERAEATLAARATRAEAEIAGWKRQADEERAARGAAEGALVGLRDAATEMLAAAEMTPQSIAAEAAWDAASTSASALAAAVKARLRSEVLREAAEWFDAEATQPSRGSMWFAGVGSHECASVAVALRAMADEETKR